MEAPGRYCPGQNGSSNAGSNGAALPKYRARFHNKKTRRTARKANITSSAPGTGRKASTRRAVKLRYSALGVSEAAVRSRKSNLKHSKKIKAPIALPEIRIASDVRRRPGAR